MRSMIRWCAALGLAGSITFGSLFAGVMEALALTREQILQRLGHVPVFTLTDAQGAPLVASQGEGQQATSISGVFINRADAQQFLDNLRRNNPQLANNVRVTPVSLAEIYELATENNQQNRIQFTFVPSQQDLAAAQQLLQSDRQNANQEFQGVPLFIARSSGQDGGYLTIRQGERQVVPLYFRRQELQGMIDRLRQQQPDLANRVTIQVTSLEGLIQMLRESNNQQEMEMLFLVPPRESIDFIRSLQQQGQGQNQQRPAAGQQNQQRPAAGQQNQQRPAQPQPNPPARP